MYKKKFDGVKWKFCKFWTRYGNAEDGLLVFKSIDYKKKTTNKQTKEKKRKRVWWRFRKDVKTLWWWH